MGSPGSPGRGTASDSALASQIDCLSGLLAKLLLSPSAQVVKEAVNHSLPAVFQSYQRQLERHSLFRSKIASDLLFCLSLKLS